MFNFGVAPPILADLDPFDAALGATTPEDVPQLSMAVNEAMTDLRRGPWSLSSIQQDGRTIDLTNALKLQDPAQSWRLVRDLRPATVTIVLTMSPPDSSSRVASPPPAMISGLGGYHGSVDVQNVRIYFAVGVYSQKLPNGKENGIAVFDQPWKNVVATFYHELNEARTDPDVDEAIETNRVEGVIGWNSDQGEECGDFPVFEAGDLGDLSLVFQEVAVGSPSDGDAPVQFQYSNAVHGPEGPIGSVHPLLIAREIEEQGEYARPA